MRIKFGKKKDYEPFTPYGVRHVTIPGVMRIHMRRDKAGSGMVWVNGTNLLLVDKVGANFIEIFIESVWENKSKTTVSRTIEDAVVKEMKIIYPNAPETLLRNDFSKVYNILQSVASGACPTHELSLDIKEIDPNSWKAPSRMDLAITYRCNNNCSICYAGGPRTVKELSTGQWKKIIDRLWNIGVPQLVFTGGEATCRKDLVELVNYSREFVTGLITNGRKLSLLADKLRDASLDYVQISIESATKGVHDKIVGEDGAWKETVEGIRTALELKMEVITNTTLTKENYAQFPDLIRFGKELGLKTMACNALICSGKGRDVFDTEGLDESQLKEILLKAQEVAKESEIDLQWYSPTCYKRLNPIDFGLGIKACSAAQYNMTIEPDGRVIPCQSWIHEGVGNILKDSWEKIWLHPTCVDLRNNRYAGEECFDCPHLPACGGGCPLERSEAGIGIDRIER